MAGLLNTSSMMMCPHGGTVNAICSNAKAQAGGAYLLRASDTFTIAGCAFTVGTTLHPCVRVQWVRPAMKSRAVGDFTLTEQSLGLCIAADQAVQGTVQISHTQSVVSGL